MWILSEGPYPSIEEVSPDSAAGPAGVAAGDIILRIDGIDLSGRSILEVLGRMLGGDKPCQQLEVVRQGTRRVIEWPRAARREPAAC